MLLMFGHYVQAIAIGEGPIENGASPIADLFAPNSWTSACVTQLAPTPVAMFAASSRGVGLVSPPLRSAALMQQVAGPLLRGCQPCVREW